MLYLISIGLSDEKDISLRALETAKKCAKIYVEFYTTGIKTDTRKLSELVGKDVVEIKRADLEENASKIISQAKSIDIGVLVGGDALSATTHISFLLDAKRAGVKTKVIHGSSIFSAVTETGLQLYKFGAVTTLARPLGKYLPDSCYDVVLKNKKMDLHSLVLLDIGMSVIEGLEVLLKIGKNKPENVFTQKTKLVSASRLGSDNQKIKYDTIENLAADEELNDHPAVIILPGNLHFLEEEFLESL